MCDLEYKNTALKCPKERAISNVEINFNKLLSLLREKDVLSKEESLRLLTGSTDY